ncbi:MAG: chorismate synthase [Solobacterium sp.]|nr:chorismate synthase [Solobacterium sp.]
MRNTIGNHITLTIFGESHGEMIGAILDGIPAGIEIDEAYIEQLMDLRKAKGTISTSRKEEDKVRIVSGVRNGFAEGTPITILIENRNVRSQDYESAAFVPRPSHADYSGSLRYKGYEDRRGGGHFSGRLTAALVASGAICMHMLEKKGIYIASHIKELHGIHDREFENLNDDIVKLKGKYFAVLNDEVEEKMKAEIEDARCKKDSLGGVLETVVDGLDAGIGNPMFDSLESLLSHAIFSIPAVKGIEFGAGFALKDMYGSDANDAFGIKENEVVTLSNHSGGIQGGISNGMPILFRTVIKPTPSIASLQQSVDLNTYREVQLEIQGRHDPAIIHRARIVVDCMTAFTLADVLVGQFGEDYFGEKR